MKALVMGLVLLLIPSKREEPLDYSNFVQMEFFASDRDTICLGDTLPIHFCMSLKECDLPSLGFISVTVIISCDSCTYSYFSEPRDVQLCPMSRKGYYLKKDEPFCADSMAVFYKSDPPGDYTVSVGVIYFRERRKNGRLTSFGGLRTEKKQLHVKPYCR